jgi:AcrR family transcriptional regulator
MPRPSQRQHLRDATRQQLIDAGLRMVAESGFAATSTSAIAKATGKAHGTVFAHFSTRDALVTELISAIGTSMSASLSANEREAPSIAEVMDAHLQALAQHEPLYARLLGESTTLPPAARAQVFALQSGIAARLRSAYARASAQEVRAVDPFVLATIWISLTNHYVMHRDLFAPGASVIAKHGHKLKTQVLSLVLVHGTQEPAS